jgi:glyoxylase-like metal-dependent hydrolase (beta-lactamase superfamily II)/rhodanese-related sulfurtransferase
VVFGKGGSVMAANTIKVRDLYDRMQQGESFFIVDVRSRVDFQDWRIQGQTLKAINIPFFEFREDEINDDLIPKGTHVVVVSQDEEESQKVAEHMAAKGYDVSYLRGGINSLLNFYVQSSIVEEPRLKLIQVNRVAKGCLSYVIISGKQACVVDPAVHIDQYLEIAERERAQITHIIDTHIHTDHISGAQELLKCTNAEYFVPRSTVEDIKIPCTLLKEGTIRLGSINIRTMYIPIEGRTMGASAALVVNEEFLLAGDSIIVGEIGIPDLPGKAQEWAEKLFNTVFRRAKNLDNSVIVLPAHFADIQAINKSGYVGAYLGDLRLGVEAMSKNTKLTFHKRVDGAVAGLHPNFQEISEYNRGLSDVTEGKAKELENGGASY